MKNIKQTWFTASLVVFALSPRNLYAEGTPADSQLQENINTITNYYETVQEKASSPSPITTSKKPSLSVKKDKNTKVVNGEFDRDKFIPNTRTTQQSPIRAGANYRASAYTLAGRDPFAITPVMLENVDFKLKQDVEFTPIAGDFKIPKMHLKGIITGREDNDDPKKMAALLEIYGLGVFVVHEGDTVGLHGIGNGRDVIQIESISRLSLIVRSGSYGGAAQKRIVVR